MTARSALGGAVRSARLSMKNWGLEYSQPAVLMKHASAIGSAQNGAGLFCVVRPTRCRLRLTKKR